MKEQLIWGDMWKRNRKEAVLLLEFPKKFSFLSKLAEHDGRCMTKKKMENKKYRNVNSVSQEEER